MGAAFLYIRRVLSPARFKRNLSLTQAQFRNLGRHPQRFESQACPSCAGQIKSPAGLSQLERLRGLKIE